nr:uncharacterized protein LOC109157302 isoform X2 [Ipomoea batatas]
MFVDERSKRIIEEIQARHDAATQEAKGSTESPNINISQLYLDVVGGTNASSFSNGNSCGSSATTQLHQDAMKEMLNQQLETMRAEKEMLNQQLETMRAEMEAKLQAEINQMQAQMQAQITSLMDELRRNGMLSTSMPPSLNTQAEHSVNSNDENLGDD